MFLQRMQGVPGMSDAISSSLGRSLRAVPPEVCTVPLPMADRKKPGPLLCAKCGGVIPAGDGHMRAPDLRVYHVDCYAGGDSRTRYRPRQ